MRSLFRAALIVAFLSGPVAARADHLWDFMAFMYTDGMTHEETTKASSTIWATSYAFSVTKGRSFFIGWNIMGVSAALDDGGGTPSTFTTMDMGPRFLFMSKSGTWQFAFNYHLRNTTSYDPGSGTTDKLKGTSMLVELGYLPEWTDSLRLGLKFNYYAPSFNESVVDDTTYSQVAYSRTTMFPSIALMASW